MHSFSLSHSHSHSLSHARTHARAPTGLILGAFLLLRPAAHLAQRPDKHSRRVTHLGDLVQQFVVLLPFLQGAQIATHPSCQGNGAVVPLECACFFCACCAACLRRASVCECASSPLGQEHTQAPLLWDPPRLSVIRECSKMPLRSFLTRIRQSWTCACVRLFVALFSAPETNT